MAAESVWAAGQNGTKAPGMIPTIEALVRLHGQPTSSAAFSQLKEQSALKFVSRSEHVDFVPPPTPQARRFRPPLRTTVVYGGGGLMIFASATIHIEGDLSSASALPEPKIERIQLIVGPSEAEEQFGRWKGELPVLDLPADPDSLLRTHSNPYSDLVEVSYANGGRIERRRNRVITYAAPWASNNPFPYAFYFENNKLVLVELLQTHTPAKLVIPQAPKR